MATNSDPKIKWANRLAEASAMVRQWTREELNHSSPAAVHHAMQRQFEAITQEFRQHHEVPGVRYWHVPEHGVYFATAAGEPLPPALITMNPLELTRIEFVARQVRGMDFSNEL